MEITDDQAEAYLLRQPISPDVRAEIERQLDDPNSVVRRLSARYAAISRQFCRTDGPWPAPPDDAEE